jgi:hypothetical protein
MQHPVADSSPKQFALSLGDGIKTLLLSLIAYASAFAYECGYCDWFGIPRGLIRLDVTRFLVFAATIVFVLGAALALTGLLYGPIRNLYSKKRELVLFLGPSVAVSLYGLLFFFLSWFYWSILWKLEALALLLLGFWLLLLLRHKGSMRERIAGVVNQFGNVGVEKILVERFGRPLGVLALLLFLLVAGSYYLGVGEARRQRNFLVMTKDSYVVFRVYGDRAICAPLNDADELRSTFHRLKARSSFVRSILFDPSFSLRNLEDFNTPLEWWEIGPLEAAEEVANPTATPTTAHFSSPTPEQSPTPTPTATPIPRAIPIATPSLTPSPSPSPARVPQRRPRRQR